MIYSWKNNSFVFPRSASYFPSRGSRYSAPAPNSVLRGENGAFIRTLRRGEARSRDGERDKKTLPRFRLAPSEPCSQTHLSGGGAQRVGGGGGGPTGSDISNLAPASDSP